MGIVSIPAYAYFGTVNRQIDIQIHEDSNITRYYRSKAIAREVFASIPQVPRAVKWSEVEIKFDQTDCPENCARPRRYLIMVEPTINNC